MFDEHLAVTVTDVVRKRNGCVVGALDQRRLDEVADTNSLTRTQMHGRLADRGSVCPDTHDVPPMRMLERDENRHQLRDARDRHARPGTVLREHLAGGWVLDDERPRLRPAAVASVPLALR